MSTFTLHSFSVAGPLTRPYPSKQSLSSTFRQRSISLFSSSTRSLPLRLLCRRSFSTVVALAAPREDSHSEKEEGDEGSQEEWKQALESFKEQALKMQSVSQEAYELYTKKATVLLQETSERLKIQRDKPSQDLNVILNEISENSKVYLATAAENTPEPVKEIVETYASSTEEVSSFGQLQDFRVLIAYGAGLTVGGFLYFMVIQSDCGIRSCVMLGGALLADRMYRLRSWKQGGPSQGAITGLTAFVGILFMRELRLIFLGASFSTFFATLFSGAMTGIYIYLLVMDGKKPNLENGTEN